MGSGCLRQPHSQSWTSEFKETSNVTELLTMQKVLHLKATVQPGGKLEIVSPELEAGQTVDVVVLHKSSVRGRSVMEILAQRSRAPSVPDSRRGEGVLGGRESIVGPLILPYGIEGNVR